MNESLLSLKNVSKAFDDKTVLNSLDLDILDGEFITLLGPSGCGKTTLLRLIAGFEQPDTGAVVLSGHNITQAAPEHRPLNTVFQNYALFPHMSVYDNVAYGPRIHGLANRKSDLDEIVENSLRKAGLWNEAKDRLDSIATGMSGGQQQRLCIARAIAVSPEVILMDEPCSALDPIATARVEELIAEMSESYTIVIVTHSMQQAARVSHRTAYFHLGHLVEVNETNKVFTSPEHELTESYITGRFG